MSGCLHDHWRRPRIFVLSRCTFPPRWTSANEPSSWIRITSPAAVPSTIPGVAAIRTDPSPNSSTRTFSWTGPRPRSGQRLGIEASGDRLPASQFRRPYGAPQAPRSIHDMPGLGHPVRQRSNCRRSFQAHVRHFQVTAERCRNVSMSKVNVGRIRVCCADRQQRHGGPSSRSSSWRILCWPAREFAVGPPRSLLVSSLLRLAASAAGMSPPAGAFDRDDADVTRPVPKFATDSGCGMPLRVARPFLTLPRSVGFGA